MRLPRLARSLSRRRRLGLAALLALVLALAPIQAASSAAGPVDEVHYTFTGPGSVAFDWRGEATEIRYGTTTAYGQTATAHTPDPLPFSSAGPFQEAELSGLSPGATYHYSIGGGPDQTFTTAPAGNFRFDVEADIGSSLTASAKVAPTQSQIASDNPAFVLAVGDLSYGDQYGQAAVDRHFNDVMAWSRQAAYMPVWGNHEWSHPEYDDLRNYKGRFALPNAQASAGAPSPGCCGEDWSWFDAGGVRFVSYPEPYTAATWPDWQAKADAVMATAQADPGIRYIVSFGHRPAYSTGNHPGSASLASILNGLGDKYSKYVLNLNGHSHDYERFQPIHGVTHITSGGGGEALEPPWSGADSRTVYRAMHLEHLRIDLDSGGMHIAAVCGPATAQDDTTCTEGSLIDSYTIDAPRPAPTVRLSSPADGSLTNNSTPTLGGTAGTATGDSPSVDVNVYGGASTSGPPIQTRTAAVAANSTWSVAASPALGDGSYTVQAKQASSNGTGSSSIRTFTVDTQPPGSKASVPAYSGGGEVAVSYGASDPGPAGLQRVDLYANGPGEASYSKVASDSSPGASGSLSYSAAAGEGVYSFYTVATDRAGNAEAAPGGPDATTLLDTQRPTSQASAPLDSTTQSLTVSYTASDPGSGASGLAKVELYAKAPGEASYSNVATDSSPGASSSFSYSAAAGSGSYSFYTVASDKAGNPEAVGAEADATTLYAPPANANGGSLPTIVTFPTSITAPLTFLVQSSSKQKLRTVLREGVRARIRCSSACSYSMKLMLGARTARNLRLTRGSKAVTIGRASGAFRAAADAGVSVKLSKAAKRAVRSRRLLKLELRTGVVDAGGKRFPPRTVKVLLRAP